MAKKVLVMLMSLVDVWACAVTLYNMITGRLPFEFDDDNNLMQLYEDIQQRDFSFPSPIPKDLEDLLRGKATFSSSKP